MLPTTEEMNSSIPKRESGRNKRVFAKVYHLHDLNLLKYALCSHCSFLPFFLGFTHSWLITLLVPYESEPLFAMTFLGQICCTYTIIIKTGQEIAPGTAWVPNISFPALVVKQQSYLSDYQSQAPVPGWQILSVLLLSLLLLVMRTLRWQQ